MNDARRFLRARQPARTNSKERWHVRALDPLTLFTLMLTIATGFLAYLAYKQYQVLDKTDHTLKDTLAASNAVQRAVIAVSKLQIDPIRDEKGNITHWQFTPYLKNSGNTQATYVKSNGIMSGPTHEVKLGERLYPNVRLPEAPRDPEFIYKIDKRNGKAIVGPGVEGPVSVGGVPVDALKLSKRPDYWYIYGITKYRDVFKDTQTHVTKFCFVITPVANWTGNTPPDYMPCGYWNCADETCAQDRQDYETDMRAAFKEANIPLPDLID